MALPRTPIPSAYEWTARQNPALLTLLPLLLLAAIWLPEVWTALGALMGLLTFCGVTYVLAQAARGAGKRLETRLVDFGPALSLALLRHEDPRVDRHTKQRYHAFLGDKCLPLPSPEEERADPLEADSRYRACVTWLREATRDEKRFKLLLQENTAYGFRRNLLALKPLAVPILLVALLLNGVMIGLHWQALTPQVSAGAVIEIALAGALAFWIMAVTPAFMAEASTAYGLRLLASCDQLDSKPATKGRAKA